ncbi:MAG: glutathione S-transferase family protein [Undibacterium sp.]|nr:glutathione S-transferase family protein [Undibacterium sp.]
MIQLYYSPGTACLAPHFLMEELGLPYELVLVDTSKKEHQQPAYLQLNPNGKIPLLIDGDLQLTESAAICMYLADQYPDSSKTNNFSPALGTPARAQLYQWMMYLTNTLQAELLTYFYPDRLSEDEACTAQVKAKAEQRVAQMLEYVDANLAKSKGAYLLGTQLSLADLFLFMLCRWTRGMQKPARAYPHIGPYLNVLLERPSIAKAFKMEGVEAPFY